MLGVSLTDFSKNSIAALFTGCLAVAGGFLAGYLFGALLAFAFDKYVVRRASPHGLHKVIRYSVGLIVAIIVALLVFRGGTGGGDGNGGSGTGGTPGERTPDTESQPDTASPQNTKPEQSKIQIDEVVSVKIFGGADVEAGTERFFQVDNDASDGKAVMVDLGGVQARVQTRRKSAKGQIVIVYDFATTASQETTGFNILNGARDTLGASLLSPKQYQELLAKQP